MSEVSEKVSNEVGYFGEFGGSFVPPDLQGVLDYLYEQFMTYKDDPEFKDELQYRCTQNQ